MLSAISGRPTIHSISEQGGVKAAISTGVFMTLPFSPLGNYIVSLAMHAASLS